MGGLLLLAARPDKCLYVYLNIFKIFHIIYLRKLNTIDLLTSCRLYSSCLYEQEVQVQYMQTNLATYRQNCAVLNLDNTATKCLVVVKGLVANGGGR